jgi:hypothetical protein
VRLLSLYLSIKLLLPSLTVLLLLLLLSIIFLLLLASYSQVLGGKLFKIVISAVIAEPKWMVGSEWDMINLARDIYCRLVLGQSLLPGGQGPGMQQNFDASMGVFNQSKVPFLSLPLSRASDTLSLFVSNSLLLLVFLLLVFLVHFFSCSSCSSSKFVVNARDGGGILTSGCLLPRETMQSLVGVTAADVQALEERMRVKRSAKDQKDCFRDVLRACSDALATMYPTSNEGKVNEEESILQAKSRARALFQVDEVLVIKSKMKQQSNDSGEGFVGDSFFGNM